MRLTNTSVAALELPPGKDRLMVFDEDLAGFGVRVSRSAKAYFVQYRNASGESRRETLGKAGMLSANDARKQATDRLLRVKAGEDPRAQVRKAREAPTFGSLIEPYLEERKGEISEKWHKDVTRHLKEMFEPVHKLPAKEIMRSDLHPVMLAIKRERGRTTANRAHATLSRFYSWLIATDVVDHNIVSAMEKPGKEQSRERVLKRAELAAIWHALRDDDYGDIVRLLMLTLQRREEVAAMSWEELDLPGALWHMSGKRTKNSVQQDVTLSPQALAILERRPMIEGRDLLFGEGKGPFSGFSKAKAALDERSGVTGWIHHDLRRTATTVMGDELGIPPHIPDAIMNHVSGVAKKGVAGIYNRATYLRDQREALDLWGRYIAAL